MVLNKLKALLAISAGGTAVFAAVSIVKGNEKFYNNMVMPVVHLLEPEVAHRLAVVASKYNVLPKSGYIDPPSLKCRVFNRTFLNPVGMAAGFDKHCECVHGLHNLGFGFVEVGSVTPLPQPGNPKPRVFRLAEDLAVINRYGFNSDGHDRVLQRLKALKSGDFDGVVGVNLGKNKDSTDAVHDYVEGVNKFGGLADYLVINVSSPNTPGLRNLQSKQFLEALLTAVVDTRNNLPMNNKPPILLKLAPDLSRLQLSEISQVIRLPACRVDGLIISNTTVQRPAALGSDLARETGGLSGAPLRDVSTRMIADMYKLTDGEIPIIGVGGISSGQDAYDKMRAGASLVQVYTAVVYQGPPCAARIKRELAQLLHTDGYRHVSQIVGLDANVIGSNHNNKAAP